MKVATLIKELEKMPQDADVIMCCDWSGDIEQVRKGEDFNQVILADLGAAV